MTVLQLLRERGHASERKTLYMSRDSYLLGQRFWPRPINPQPRPSTDHPSEAWKHLVGRRVCTYLLMFPISVNVACVRARFRNEPIRCKKTREILGATNHSTTSATTPADTMSGRCFSLVEESHALWALARPEARRMKDFVIDLSTPLC